jgi:hypothetical protein
MADSVAKLAEESSWQAIARKNRIGPNKFLNQHCARAPDRESILLARTLKIVLQHYRHFADLLCA